MPYVHKLQVLDNYMHYFALSKAHGVEVVTFEEYCRQLEAESGLEIKQPVERGAYRE